MPNFNIINKTRIRLPRALFSKIKTATLGSSHNLNLIVVGPITIKKLNAIHRGKDNATDILSFPLSKNEGDMYICPSETRKEAEKFGRTYDNFLIFLFIHGCVHLKGYDHGGTMERIEKKVRAKFNI